VFGAIDNDA